MKKTHFILLAIALIFYATAWAQTSYGDLIQGNAGGNLGGDTNSYFGYQAGISTTDGGASSNGKNNTFIGYQSGLDNFLGHSNTFIGSNSGKNVLEPYNTYIGSSSGRNNSNGEGNVFLGSFTGYNAEGDNNVYLGRHAGYEAEGSYNVFLGYEAGYNEILGSNLLYIDNSNTSSPLIWGDFSANLLRINGILNINDAYSFPTTDGAINQVLSTNGSGNVSWVAATVDTNTERTDEEIMDVVGAMVSGNTEEYISVTYDDAANKFDFAVPGNLSAYVNDLNFITNPDDADADSNNEIQNLSYDANPHTLSIDKGNSLNIAPFPSYPASAGDGGGNTNSYFGHLAGAITTGTHNTFIGHQSGLNTTTGYDNSSLGSRTLENNIGGYRNTANGVYTLFANTEGYENTAVGYSALGWNETGYHNTATGFQALWISNGNHNTANGYLALSGNITGSGNTAMGHNAMISNTSGIDNIALGRDVMSVNTTGNGNVAIGYDAGPSTNNALENTVAIGYEAKVDGNNATALGNGANAIGDNSTAIGNGTLASGAGDVRIGNDMVSSIGGFQGWTTFPSDSRFKINVAENISGLDFINKLRPVSYNVDLGKVRNALNPSSQGKSSANSLSISEKRVGFIAQEVEEIVEENGYVFSGVDVPDNEKDIYGIRYAKFVVPLVKGVQELSAENKVQQALIEDLQQEIETLKKLIYGADSGISDGSTQTKNEGSEAEGFALQQNVPNPFDKTTIISARIPESVQDARLVIYNLQGLELKRYDLNERGKTSVEISGGIFPSGMYLYALIADGRIIDTKKMILTK